MTQIYRLESLRFAKAESRRFLRARFNQFLSIRRFPHSTAKGGVALTDETALSIFADTKIAFASDLSVVERSYRVAATASEPTWDDLVEAGWIDSAWGRVRFRFELYRTAMAQKNALPSLALLIEGRYSDIHTVSPEIDAAAIPTELVERIKDPSFSLSELGCQRPDWVAARLWEIYIGRNPSQAEALRHWYDRWKLLDFPKLVPHLVWNNEEATAFIDAGLHTIEHNYSRSSWEDWRAFKLRQIALIRKQDAIDDSAMPPIPRTLVDRAAWLRDNRVESFTYDDASDELRGLLRLLLGDVEATDVSPVPNELAKHILDLAIERPALLSTLVTEVQLEPILLADMLLSPTWCPLACQIVSRWKFQGSAWEQKLVSEAASENHIAAFRDCLSVFAWFLENGELDIDEIAALFADMQDQPGTLTTAAQARNREAFRTVLRAAPEASNESLFFALSTSAARAGVGSKEFAAAVDLLDIAHLSGTSNAFALIDTYTSSVASGDHGLSALGISVSGAAALVNLARCAGDERFDRFIFAVNDRQYQSQAAFTDGNDLAGEKAIRSIRTHARVLSRSIAGDAGIDDSIVDALCILIRRGATEHSATSRVAAFAARFEAWPYPQEDRPISVDLGSALHALPDQHQQRVLDALLEIDEPLTLAKLIASAPTRLRTAITTRLDLLTPEKAPRSFSITASQARIDALLSINMSDLAALYMAKEQSNSRAASIPGVALSRLRESLHLKVLTGNWQGLREATIAEDMPVIDQASAQDTLLFFKAIGAVRDDNGDRDFAFSAFHDLHTRHPSIGAYAVNLFAARVAKLLKADTLGSLAKADRIVAQEALEELEKALESATDLTDEAQAVVAFNRGRLLLAMGNNEGALKSLGSVTSQNSSPAIIGLESVATARSGRAAEALAALDHADRTFGKSDFTEQIREYIRTGKQFAIVGEWVLVERDIVKSTRGAWLELATLNPDEQATVLSSVGGNLLSFAVQQVRAASASLSSLAPMIKDVKLDSFEDDLNSLLQQLLLNRLDFLKWSVLDQSRGGYSAKGGVGQRDLVIGRGTSELAVIEAMFCKTPLHWETVQDNLRTHFRKVFGYSGCAIFFHVTYSYGNDVMAVLNQLKDAIAVDPPSDFEFLGCDELELFDSQPIGLLANYRSKRSILSVIFLVIDMSQNEQRTASGTANLKHSN